MSARFSPTRRTTILTEPVLYSFRRCPFAMRARMALMVSGTVCEIREVKLRDKPAEMIAASPKGTVPVLVLADGAVIDESIDIMRWALTRNDPEGWLEGDDAALIAANDGRFKHHLDRYKYPERHGADPAVHRDEGLAMLAELNVRLAARACLCGERPMLADAAIMPFVRQFAAVDREAFDAASLPWLQRWLADLMRSDLFERIMTPRQPWRTGDAAEYLR